MEERMALNRQRTTMPGAGDTKEPQGELGSVVPAAAATAKEGAPGAGSAFFLFSPELPTEDRVDCSADLDHLL